MRSAGLKRMHVGAEADPGRQERHAPRRGLQAEQEHALVELHRARPRPTGGRCGSAARARSSRATRRRRRPRGPCPPGTAARRRGRRTTTTRRSLHRRAQSARTRAIGLRREPQPPMPTVMPSCTSPTISSMVTRLSGTTHCSISDGASWRGWRHAAGRHCGAMPECPADGRSSLRRASRDRDRRLPGDRPGDRAALRRGRRRRARVLPERARDAARRRSRSSPPTCASPTRSTR